MSVLFIIMTSHRTAHRLRDAPWCRHEQIRCVAFTDVPMRSGRYTRVIQQDPVTHAPTNCCDENTPQLTDDELFALNQSRTYPPNQFFCDEHRRKTLAAQYRYLPALVWARHTLSSIHQRDWVILADDDTRVNVETLLAILKLYNHHKPLYLGDFLFGDDESGPEGTFACGGAGSVFSAAAMRMTNFSQCHEHFRSSCLQSDWMLARCALDAGVRPVRSAGCHCCAPGDVMKSISAIRRGCLACQYNGRLHDKEFVDAMREKLPVYDGPAMWHL